jgi:hypothetical protein
MAFQMLFRVVSKRSRPLVCGLISCSVWLCFFQLPVQADQSVALTWDAGGDPAIAGYRIYYGLKSQSYAAWMDVGNVTQTTITGLAAGTTYYFAATTYYDSGEESDYSNETAFTVPADAANYLAATSTTVTNPATLAAMSQSGGHFNFTVSGAEGSTYILETSSNLVDWIPVQTNAAPFAFVESGGSQPQQFYRAVGAETQVPAAGAVALAQSEEQFNVSVSGTPGFNYVIEASTDMVNWIPVQTNTAPFTFVDSDADGTPRYYRAIGETVVSLPAD